MYMELVQNYRERGADRNALMGQRPRVVSRFYDQTRARARSRMRYVASGLQFAAEVPRRNDPDIAGYDFRLHNIYDDSSLSMSTDRSKV